MLDKLNNAAQHSILRIPENLNIYFKALHRKGKSLPLCLMNIENGCAIISITVSNTGSLY
jgi:hypothetical protein